MRTPPVLRALIPSTLILLGAAIIGVTAGNGAAVAQEPNWFNGDANCDGRIDSLDALAVLQFEAGLLEELPDPVGGDPNEDGTVESADALLILQFHAGLIPDRTPNLCLSTAEERGEP